VKSLPFPLPVSARLRLVFDMEISKTRVKHRYRRGKRYQAGAHVRELTWLRRLSSKTALNS
jgi:hypothetical protein